jgi:pimeloyl-ACP methyl ester carboxylesterase
MIRASSCRAAIVSAALLGISLFGVSLSGCGGDGGENLLTLDPVKFTALQTFTADDLTAFMKTTLGAAQGDPRFGTLPDATDGATYYRVTYPSVNFSGNPVTLSGAVAIPTGGSVKGLVIYMHGTSLGQNECPSAGISGPNAYHEGATAISAFLSGGYAVALPDYIGQGVSNQPHPYVMASKNAASGRDLASAAYQMATELGVSIAPKLFVTGYSEGGQNAMGLCQLLESEPIEGLTFTASAPMSGPYDLSGAQRLMLMGLVPTQPDAIQFAPLMLVGDIAYAANAYYEIPSNTLFKKNIASKIPTFFDGSKTTKSVLESLLLPATLDGYIKDSSGNYHLASIMVPAAAQGLNEPNPGFPLYKMLQEYDTYDWKPTVPMYLTGLSSDTLVSFGNTQSAVNAMRTKGVDSATMGHHAIVGPELNHLSNISGSCILARRFFDGGFDAVPTDADPG